MVDYSKWKDIEISDDEDETHPNVTHLRCSDGGTKPESKK